LKETFVTAKIRLLVGGTTLAAGLWLLTAATAAPPLPKESAKKVIAADIASVQALTTDIAGDADPSKTKRGPIRTVRTLVLMIAAQADATGDAALRSHVGKLGQAIDKASETKDAKDWKAVADVAKGLSAPKADPSVPKGALVKHDLEDVMSPFRVSKSGGMNVEKDIRDIIAAGKKGGKIDPTATELIGGRCVSLSDYAQKLPNDKARTNPASTKKWDDYCKRMADAGKELTEESAKGAGADQKKLLGALNKLNASCTDCHNDFRNE
jgi:hypothetical protein